MRIPNRIRRWHARRRIVSTQSIPTHLTDDERAMLYVLARRNNCRVVVEIGSYLGASACCLAKALQDAGGRARLFCVDTWKNEGMSEGPRDTHEEFLANTQGFNDVIVVKRGRSTDVAASFGQLVDLVFFDGDHSLEAVREDWTAWGPRLASGALVVFHDYGWAPGVQGVVDELVAPQTHFHGRLPNMWWGRCP